MQSLSKSLYILVAVVGLSPLVVGLPTATAQDLSPAPLVALRGKATKLGYSARSVVSLSGLFEHSSPLNLKTTTVTVEAILDESGGAGELLEGLPLVLEVQPGAKPRGARYATPFGVKPRTRMNLRDFAKRPAFFTLTVQSATLGYPQTCAGGLRPTTQLAVRLVLDDGINIPLSIDSDVTWSCVGRNPAAPLALFAR